MTDIIWNLPIATKSALLPEKWGLPIIGDSPMHDDIRVVIRHSPDEFQMELTHVPLLKGWSKRFRNKGTGLVTRSREIEEVVPKKTLRNRIKVVSLTMIPWLVRLWQHETLDANSTETLEEQVTELNAEFRGVLKSLTITKTVLIEPPCRPSSLFDLMKFRLPETMDAQSYQSMTAGRINSQRLYRSPRKLQNKPLQEVSSTEETLTIEEEPEQDWLFGVKFESEGDDPLPWWMVIQDPSLPSRLLIGCFINRQSDKDGFLWAVNKQEILKQSSLDEILGYSQTILTGRKKGEELDLWSSRESDDAVYEGTIEFRKQGRSTRGNLLAIRHRMAEEPQTKPSSTTRPSESFYKRIVDSLRSQITAVASPTPVTVQLEIAEDVCHVSMKNDEGEELQDITISYTADLISLLRWPMVKGGPIFTDSGAFVTWDIFDDIDYGELDFIRPYVTYTAARTAPAELPERVTQFFQECEDLSVSFTHDASVCPIVQSSGVDHEACWRIILPSRCPVRVREQLDRVLTGEEVNGLLAPGRLYAGRLYTFEITRPSVSEKDESIVFHEDRYIRILLRKLGLPLKRLTPGTFLQTTDQHWRVYIEWDDPYFMWQAQSVVSALFFSGTNQTVELVQGHGLQEECDRLLKIITSQIPSTQIDKYSNLEEIVHEGLKKRGYSKTGPACELKFIEQSDTMCRYGVFLRNGSRSEALFSATIDATKAKGPDIVIEGIDRGFSSEEMSGYNIRNVKVFLEKISIWVNEHVPEIED